MGSSRTPSGRKAKERGAQDKGGQPEHARARGPPKRTAGGPERERGSRPEPRIRGTVTDRTTGAPLPGLKVVARSALGPGDRAVEATTTRDGTFEIPYDKALRHEGADELRVEVQDDRGRVLLRPGARIAVARPADVHLALAVPGEARHWGADGEVRALAWVEGHRVDLLAAARLTRGELLEAYRALRHGGKGKALERVREAVPDLLERRQPAKGAEPFDDCGEGRLGVLRALIAERGDADQELADADDFPGGTTVRWFYTQNIAVKYTTDDGSVHQVTGGAPGSDAELQLPDGTSLGWVRANLADLHADNTEVAPAYVQKVGLIAEHALSRFISPAFGMRDPRDGAARMEYRILAQDSGIAGSTSGSWSHVEVAPGNSDAQNFGTVPHELFHQVQYRYNATTTRDGIYGILREGGARLAEDSVNDQPNRYVASGATILNATGTSLENFPSGTKNPIRYGAGLFWKYVAEQHSPRTNPGDEPAIGVETYREVLEATATAQPTDPGLGYTIAALRTARAGLPWYGRFDRFRFYDAARTELDSHETTWCNYLVANWLHGTANPVADRRYEYMEDEAAVPSSGSIAKLAALQAAVDTNDDLLLGQGDSITRNVSGHASWAARYYRIRPDGAPPPRMLRVTLSTAAGMDDPVIQVLRIGPGGALVDVHRSDDAAYQKTINMDGLDEVVVIVASRDGRGDFTVQFDEVEAASDVMVTRWNSRVGTEYETDPRGWAWTWVSPDVMVDNDDDGMADTQVFFGQDNKLKVRLRNRGNQRAENIEVDFWYQKATPYLTASGWIPLQNLAAVTQRLTGIALDPGEERWLEVAWAPVDDGTQHPHWCVKVKAAAPGDPNSDNKLCLSNFGQVVVDDSDPDTRLVSLLLRGVELGNRHKLHIVPRGAQWTLAQRVVPDGIAVAGVAAQAAGDPAREGTRAAPVPVGTAMACARRAEVAPVPQRIARAHLQVVRAEPRCHAWDGVRRERAPQAGTYYPVDAKALPPGVDPKDLVTVAHLIDGEVVGGFTYQVLRR